MRRKLVVTLFFLWPGLYAFAQLTVSVSVNSVTCYGGANGSATVLVSGGSGAYDYLWSDPQAQTTATAFNLTSGSYLVEIADGAGNDTMISVFVPQPDPIHISSVVHGAFCNAANGKITLQVTGSTPPYTYAWAHLPSSASSAIASDLSPGEYHVAVTDANNCVSDTTIIVDEAPCPVKGEIVFTPNGDGINDTWSIANLNYFPNALIAVFNRWGQKVFESEGEYKKWDGTHMGTGVPDGIYYYVIYRDKDNRDEGVETGSVTIVR